MWFMQLDSVKIGWFVSVLTKQILWLAQKSSQMCNKEVRITESGFIFIGACNAPYNRIGNAVNTTLKLPVFLLSVSQFIFLFNCLLFKSTLLIYNLLSFLLAVCGKIANKR
jgi:hypothetical protein